MKRRQNVCGLLFRRNGLQFLGAQKARQIHVLRAGVGKGPLKIPKVKHLQSAGKFAVELAGEKTVPAFQRTAHPQHELPRGPILLAVAKIRQTAQQALKLRTHFRKNVRFQRRRLLRCMSSSSGARTAPSCAA